MSASAESTETPWILLTDAPPRSERASGCHKVAADFLKLGSSALRAVITRRFDRSISKKEIVETSPVPVLFYPDTSFLRVSIPQTVRDLLALVFLLLGLPRLRRAVAKTGAQRLFALSGAEGIFLLHVRLIAWATGLPFDLYLVDDIEAWTRIHRSKFPVSVMRGIERSTLRRAKRVFAISQGYADHLQRKYSVSATWLPLPMPMWTEPKGTSIDPTLTFTGGLSSLYSSALVDLYEVIQEQNRRTPEARLRLQVITYSDPTSLTRLLPNTEDLILHRNLSDAERDRLLRESLACFLPYAFAPEVRILVRTSFSCKTIDYFTAGRPILAYGPPDSSIAGYFRTAEFPFSVSSKAELATSLETLRELNSMELEGILKKYREAWSQWHSPAAILRVLGY